MEQLMNIAYTPRRGRRRRPAFVGGQRGMVLLVAIIVLGLMFLAGLGVMRAADTGNVISGNYSFQQAATQASDRAVTDALNTLAGLVPAQGGNTSVANRYLSTRAAPAALDARGIPTAINWGAGGVTCVNELGVAIGNCTVDAGNYRIQYVIERQCTVNPDLTSLTSIRANCEYEPTGVTLPTTAAGIPLRYRVLIRVRGPRGTDGFYEVMVSGPASTT
jgi:type IV pilus assembly protein PilX